MMRKSQEMFAHDDQRQQARRAPDENAIGGSGLFRTRLAADRGEHRRPRQHPTRDQLLPFLRNELQVFEQVTRRYDGMSQNAVRPYASAAMAAARNHSAVVPTR